VSILTHNIQRLPANFRILITSRREEDLEKAFIPGSFLRVLHMDDHSFIDTTRHDISQ
jgi:hypothetical protein